MDDKSFDLLLESVDEMKKHMNGKLKKCIDETMLLNSMPRLAESIIEGGKEPLSTCETYVEDEGW